MLTSAFFAWFLIEPLAIVMITLISFVGLVVAAFSSRYLEGDNYYRRFFVLLSLLVASLIALVGTDHLGLFLVFWGLSNFLLVKLMVHKPQWQAAKAAGSLAGKYFIFGISSLFVGFGLLYAITGETSLYQLIHHPQLSVNFPLVTALLFIFIGAMVQSAIWPFHRWLLSSLTSPTPVSALMHAGLVNGGGFLLVRLAPLYSQSPRILLIIFTLGMVTALLGTLWKLMQQDVKRMLTCSTMGQMGFMFVQCGLGLFPAAVAHLCFHGLFKAYLFLASGSAAQEKRLALKYPHSALSWSCALICGALGALSFSLITHHGFPGQGFPGPGFPELDSTLLLTLIAFLGSSQFSLILLQNHPLKNLSLSLCLTFFIGGLYGISVALIQNWLEIKMAPQSLHLLHFMGMGLLVASWLGSFVMPRILQNRQATPLPTWGRRFYVQALNGSQPHPATVTCHRNHYQAI